MDAIPDNTPPGWHESLERSTAQIEAGQAMPLAPFLERLRASIARMKAKPRDPAPETSRKA